MSAVSVSRLLAGVLALPTLLLASACEPAPTPPSNDNFAAATVLPSLAQGPTTASTVGATRQQGEPAAPATTTVWFRWTAPTSGAVAFTASSGLPMLVEPFTGSSVSSLRRVITDDAIGKAVFRTSTRCMRR